MIDVTLNYKLFMLVNQSTKLRTWDFMLRRLSDTHPAIIIPLIAVGIGINIASIACIRLPSLILI